MSTEQTRNEEDNEIDKWNVWWYSSPYGELSKTEEEEENSMCWENKWEWEKKRKHAS